MKTNHTPGPWIVHKWRREHKTAKGENQPRFQWAVATVDGSPIDTITKNEANAYLIAAAPEMLVALELAERALENVTNENFKAQALIYIQRAIANATGGGK